MEHIALGRIDGNGPLRVDLLTLIDTRLLVQANSGGGKSGTLRLIAERASSSIQTIILDNEGEFATLREKVDMLLVGDGGELPADPRAAGLLARRLLETQVSAVIDLYDLPLDKRREFVQRFLESLIALPRNLWRPTLVMLDEAHLYAPQGGDVDSTKAVIALTSQGRKRGYCAVLATQRLSKLHKDAAAECNNVLIGRTWLDVDQQRAGDVLGMSKADRAVLRDLAAREFYGFGPAFSEKGVFRFRTGDVATTMPKAGHRFEVTVPPPSSKVRALLAAELANLPEAAEAEAQEVETLRRENALMRRELAARPTTVDEVAISQAVAREVAAKDIEIAALRRQIGRSRELAEDAQGAAARVIDALELQPAKAAAVTPPASRPMASTARTPASSRSTAGNGKASDLSGPEQRILDAVAWMESIGIEAPEQTAVAFLAGYTVGGGAFNNPRGALRTKGLIDYRGSSIVLTDAGRAKADWPTGALTAEELQRRVLDRLPGPEQKILRVLLEHYPKAIDNDTLARKAGYEPGGGAFNNPRGRLRSLGLIDYPERGQVAAQPVLFLEESRR